MSESSEMPAVSPRSGRSHSNGYRFGPGNWTTTAPKGEVNVLTKVPGASIAPDGFELLAYDGTFVAWFACPLDAVDAMKVHAGPGKVVRCSDRCLIKIRHPRRWRL